MSADPDKLEIARLDALVKLRGDEDSLRALLEKATTRRDAEMAVYARVIADYEARIAAIAGQVQAERTRAREVLQTLASAHERRRLALEGAQAKLQECEFRHSIGEYSAEQFATASQQAEAAIVECEAAFESVRVLRERYLELLADVPAAEVAAPDPPRAAVAPAKAPASAKVPAPAPVAPATPAAPPAAAAPVAPVAPPVPPIVPPPVPAPSPVAAAPPVESDATVYMPQPSPGDFSVPGQGDALDTGSFGTVLISAALLIEQRGGLPGMHHRLGLLTTIGRTADNHIVVPLKDVSRRHAEVRMAPNGYLLKDLESPNGTFVNGNRVTEHLLQDNDSVMIGETEFRFRKP